jgi:transcriptional regulator with XRE-family HTH domain
MEEIIFPNKIRILRKMAGKSMQDLASRLGVSLSAISKIEKGYRKIDQEQMIVVADFLGTSMTDIFISEEDDDEAVLSQWKKEIERRVEQNKNNGLKIFGAGLRVLRGRKDMTLMDVADKAGLTLSVYHRIEIGQREIFKAELFAIARALDLSAREVLTKIYDMKADGSLDRALNAAENPMDSIAKISDILKTTESVYTPSGVVKFQKVLVYSRTLENGNMLVEKAKRDYAVYPMSDKKEGGIYALELSSRRLGGTIPMRSILFLDPHQAVRSGDIAAQVVSESGERLEIKLLIVKEDMDGKFFGVQYDPDEKIKLASADVAALHRVILISMN